MRLYPGQKLGQLRVERHLEHDGESDTYKVVAPEARQDWALQVLSGDVAPELSTLPTGVEHDNLVSIVQVLRIDGALSLLHEYVESIGLDSVLAGRPMTAPQVDALADGLLAGLAALHQAGHIHGRLRPAAILLDLSGSAPVPRIAKPVGQHAPGLDVRAEALRYLPPEGLLADATATARSDVWSLAAVLYELLAGRPAFVADDVAALRVIIAQAAYPELPDAVPARMRQAIAAGLSADPALRPADAAALRSAWFTDGDGPAQSLVSWADRLLERDDEALSLSAPVPLLRQTYPVVEVLWARDNAPDVERDRTPVPPRRPRAHPAPQAPAPPDPAMAEFDGPPPPQTPPMAEPTRAAEPGKPRAAPEGLRLAFIAATVGVSTVVIGMATLMCVGGWLWAGQSQDLPTRQVRVEPTSGTTAWPTPPALDQEGVPAGMVRVQLVAHSDAVRISWKAMESEQASKDPLRSGELAVLPTGTLAVAWASVTRRAGCLIDVGPETRQLRLDGRAGDCTAL